MARNPMIDWERNISEINPSVGGNYEEPKRIGSYRDGGEASAWINGRLGGGRVGVYNPIDPTYYASVFLPEFMRTPNIQGGIDTRFGRLDFGQDDTPSSFSASFTPSKNNYYLQALANALMGTDKGRF